MIRKICDGVNCFCRFFSNLKKLSDYEKNLDTDLNI